MLFMTFIQKFSQRLSVHCLFEDFLEKTRFHVMQCLGGAMRVFHGMSHVHR